MFKSSHIYIRVREGALKRRNYAFLPVRTGSQEVRWRETASEGMCKGGVVSQVAVSEFFL